MTVVARDDLRGVLESGRLPAVGELAGALQELCGHETPARIVALRTLKTNVHRLLIETGDGLRSLVLKCSNPTQARHNLLVARRWLPAIGMGDAGAQLLGCAADRHGVQMWLIYEDLGDATLESTKADRRRVAAAVESIATLHVSSFGHAILPECRYHSRDLGAAFFAANVRDAIHGLDMLRPPRVDLSPEREATRDRLLARLVALREEIPIRTEMLAVHGGPEVLLHGDLWTTNTFVVEELDGPRARFVDWDAAGVGPASYDLSTFLFRFPREDRPWILDRYRSVVASAGWRLPAAGDLNLLFETAECARYANRVVWPTVALLVDGAEWGFEELAMVAGWFDALRPALPE